MTAGFRNSLPALSHAKCNSSDESPAHARRQTIDQAFDLLQLTV